MTKILRITTVSHSLDLLLKGQLKYINKSGFDVHVACTYDKRIPIIEKREGVIYHELSLTRTINPIKDLIALYKAIRLIKKLRPDIVHSHSPKAGIIAMMAAFINKVPLKIHTVAGLPLMEASGMKKKLLILIEQITYCCADFVLPNSINQKKYIYDNISKNSKIQVLGKGSSNGIDLEYFNPDLFNDEQKEIIRKENNLKQDDIVLCFVGRLTDYKGVNELIVAFCNLNKQYSNIKLLLVGPFEGLNPLKRSVIEEIYSNPAIISVGHQSDVRPYLAVSNIFVFPSYREGFPQSLMQAASMNLACIATDINGCNEIIENGINGILIPVKSANAIEEAITELITNIDLRVSMATSARKNMVEFYEQKKFWNNIITFYNTKLNG